MLELPEALNLAKQMRETLVGKTIRCVYPPTKVHKFCWFTGDVADYGQKLRDSRITEARGFGIYAELLFDNGLRLCINDGIHLRLLSETDTPGDYQLLLEFTDGSRLVFTVSMYGGILLHDGTCDSVYYTKSATAISPFSPDFTAYFYEMLTACKPTCSMKALLATEQHFPGIGNGVVQDILFAAGLHPKRKLQTLTDTDKETLEHCMVAVLEQMVHQGGRDTEKDLFGHYGGYKTKMSKCSQPDGCTRCGGVVIKETYMGGSVYYCPNCQPLPCAH